MTTARRGPVEKCTFCGKSRHAVESLIAGPPGIYICNECVELCNTILLEELKRAGRPAPKKAPRRRTREGPGGLVREEGKRVLGVFGSHRYPVTDPAVPEALRRELAAVVLEGQEPEDRTAALTDIISQDHE